jgi:glutathione peroxidase-family protein
VELGADLATDPIDIVPANGVYAFTADDIDGTSVDLSVLTGKPTLMVNVASE